MTAAGALSARAERRLVIAGGLLAAPKSSGGLAMNFRPRREESFAQAVLSALRSMPEQERDHFKELVDWVEEYEGDGPLAPVARRTDPARHPLLLRKAATPAMAFDPCVEYEPDGDDAAQRAMDSIEMEPGGDDPVQAPGAALQRRR